MKRSTKKNFTKAALAIAGAGAGSLLSVGIFYAAAFLLATSPGRQPGPIDLLQERAILYPFFLSLLIPPFVSLLAIRVVSKTKSLWIILRTVVLGIIANIFGLIVSVFVLDPLFVEYVSSDVLPPIIMAIIPLALTVAFPALLVGLAVYASSPIGENDYYYPPARRVQRVSPRTVSRSPQLNYRTYNDGGERRLTWQEWIDEQNRRRQSSRQWKEARRLEQEAKERYLLANKTLYELDPDEFERYIELLFQSWGYRTRRRGAAGTSDGGVDIEARRDGQYIIVQCKKHKAPVGVNFVRELIGTLHVEKADKAYLVTSGTFSQEAWDAAHRTNEPVKLMDGKIITKAIQERGLAS